jgi:hypothetical protein
LIDLFENNARFLYRKSHIPDAPYSYVKDVNNKEAAKESQFQEQSASSALGVHPTTGLPEVPDERKSVFIEKFEEIGMIDPGPTGLINTKSPPAKSSAAKAS